MGISSFIVSLRLNWVSCVLPGSPGEERWSMGNGFLPGHAMSVQCRGGFWVRSPGSKPWHLVREKKSKLRFAHVSDGTDLSAFRRGLLRSWIGEIHVRGLVHCKGSISGDCCHYHHFAFIKGFFNCAWGA